MAIYYMDYENGDNGNNGTTWALAKKNTFPSLSAGDTVRFAKSPDPTSLGNGTWTMNSDTITLASACTANISTCEANWTAGTDVDTANVNSGYYREGSNSIKIEVGSGHSGAGILAHYDIGSTQDLSSYEQISLWIRVSVATADGDLKVRLYSDTNNPPTTQVETIDIPEIVKQYTWIPITINKGSALSSTVRQVAIYAAGAEANNDIYIDNIIACKSKSSADSLCLNSLISKNSNAQGGTEGWHGLLSINGTTVKIDQYSRASSPYETLYYGTTETVTTYKRECIVTEMKASTNDRMFRPYATGTVTNHITLSGGWNTSTTVQDGETLYDGLSMESTLLNPPNPYFTLEHIGGVRYNKAICPDDACIYINNCFIANCISAVSTSYPHIYLENVIVTGGGSTLYLGEMSLCKTCTLYSGTKSGSCMSADQGSVFIDCKAYNVNPISPAIGSQCHDATFINCTFDGVYSVMGNTDNNNVFINCKFDNVTSEFSFSVTDYFYAGRMYSVRNDQTANNHYIFTQYGTIYTQTTTRHTVSGVAWMFEPTGTECQYLKGDNNLRLKVAAIACAASSQVTLKVWIKKSAASNIEAKLIVYGGQLPGVASDVSATKADDTDWEEVQVQFTPTEAGVLDAYVEVKYADAATTYTDTVVVDDVTVTQA